MSFFKILREVAEDFQFPRGLTREVPLSPAGASSRFQFPRGLTPSSGTSTTNVTIPVFQFPRGLTVK